MKIFIQSSRIDDTYYFKRENLASISVHLSFRFWMHNACFNKNLKVKSHTRNAPTSLFTRQRSRVVLHLIKISYVFANEPVEPNKIYSARSYHRERHKCVKVQFAWRQLHEKNHKLAVFQAVLRFHFPPFNMFRWTYVSRRKYENKCFKNG